MNESDLKGIKRRGAAARQAGAGFFDNPFYFSQGSLDEWAECCNLWSAGWLEEDAGKDQDIARLMRLPI